MTRRLAADELLQQLLVLPAEPRVLGLGVGEAVHPAGGVAERARDTVGADLERPQDRRRAVPWTPSRARRAERDGDQHEREQHESAHDDPALDGAGAVRGVAGSRGALDGGAQDRETDGPVAWHRLVSVAGSTLGSHPGRARAPRARPTRLGTRLDAAGSPSFAITRRDARFASVVIETTPREAELAERPRDARAAPPRSRAPSPPRRVERPADLGIVRPRRWNCGPGAADQLAGLAPTRPRAGRSRARPSGAASGRTPRRSARASARPRGSA